MAAEQDHKNNDDDDQPDEAVTAIAVIAAAIPPVASASAEEQEKNNDQEQNTHRDRSGPDRRLVIIVDGAIPAPIGPIPIGVAVEFRSALELVLSYGNPVTFKASVIGQAGPWQGIEILSHAEEAA